MNINKKLSTNKAYSVPQSPLPVPAPAPAPAPAPVPLEGLLLKDLAVVLQKSQRDVQEMTEDLQLEGKIYQNERGEYLPL